MKLYLIVEGDGEVGAAPVLLRRLLSEANCFSVDVGRPIRKKQADFRNKERLQKAVKLTLLQPDCAGIIILFDGEDDCPKSVADDARLWASEVLPQGILCDVVVAYREYETWFLSSLESLRGKCEIRNDAETPEMPESRRGSKEWLEEFMPTNRAYKETIDQAKLSDAFDMGVAYRRNRSFRKMVKAVGDILSQIGVQLPNWPPTAWADAAE